VSESDSKFAPVVGKIPGTEINLGGRVFIMPPLNLNAVKRLGVQMGTLGKAETFEENLSQSMPIIHAALVRNYPDLKVEELGELIDFGNFGEVMAALVKISGFKKAVPGEAVPATH
jgi:hypothetical protein